jgi:hypothetical protein
MSTKIAHFATFVDRILENASNFHFEAVFFKKVAHNLIGLIFL